MPKLSVKDLNMSFLRFSGVSVISALLLITGCAPSGQAGFFEKQRLNVWVADEMSVVTTKSQPNIYTPIYHEQSNTIQLFCGANESLGFQLVVDPSVIPIRATSVSISSLEGRNGYLKEDILEAFHAMPVKIDSYPPWYMRLVKHPPQPVEFFDALVPLDSTGYRANFESSKRGVLWMDLNIPPDAQPGKYTGTITINSHSHAPWTVNLELTVYDFVLPDARPIKCIGGFDSNDIYRELIQRNGQPFVPVRWNRKDPDIMRGLSIVRQLMKLSHKHRLDLFDKSIKPIVKRDMNAKMTVDWKDYDAIVLPYLDGSAFEDRIGCPAWPVTVHAGWPDPKYYGGAKSKTYASAVSDLINAYKTHYSDNPAVLKRFFIWPDRTPPSRQGYNRHINLARLCRTANGQIPILSTLPLETSELSGWNIPTDFAKYVDISAAGGAFFAPKTSTTQTTGDNTLAGTWLGSGDPPYLPSMGIVAQPADVRVIPWFAMKYNCVGIFLDNVMNWQNSGGVSGAARTSLFYPGKSHGIEAVLPSIRLKRLRRGLQDITYLWLMQQHQRGDTAKKIIDSMARYAGTDARGDNYLDPRLDGWVTDAPTWFQARKLLAREVLSAVRNESPDSSEKLIAQRIAWQQFTERSQKMRVEQIRTKTVPAENNPDLLQTTVLLELYNEYGKSVTVNVDFDNLQKGWQRVTKPLTIENFPPHSRKAVELVIQSSYIPSDDTGKMELPIKIVTDSLHTQQLTAAVPFIIAGTITKKLAIDGDLSDWPLRNNYSASGFKLIGKRGTLRAGLAEKQTAVKVLRDAEYLYIGIRCDEPAPSGLKFTNSNRVTYQQLLACQEDLVEILINPSLEATGPSGLYHMVVKPNGITITEKGVSTDPPLGKSEFWGAVMKVACGRTKNAWTVEAAIKLDSIPHNQNQPFWGINFARFAPQASESSNWAQAPRYLYDPRNLGTMYLPPAEEKTLRN